jgi:hypothetical protein
MIRIMEWIGLAGCKGLGFWNGLGSRIGIQNGLGVGNSELLGRLIAWGVSGCLGSLFLVAGR